MSKTRVVEIPRLVRHPKYGKFIRKRTVCYVHDENNESKHGDTVKIVEAPPTSKKKRWELVEVLEKSREVDVAAMRAARKLAEAAGEEATESAAKETAAETPVAETTDGGSEAADEAT